MLKRGSPVAASNSTREMSWIPWRHWRMIRLILVIRTSPLSCTSIAQRANSPQSWMAKTIAFNSGRYPASNGQLMKTFPS